MKSLPRLYGSDATHATDQYTLLVSGQLVGSTLRVVVIPGG